MSENKASNDNNGANRRLQLPPASHRQRQQEPYRVHMSGLLAQMRDAERRRAMMTPSRELSAERLQRNLNHYNHNDNLTTVTIPLECYPTPRGPRSTTVRSIILEPVASNNELNNEENLTSTIENQESEDDAESVAEPRLNTKHVLPNETVENSSLRRKRLNAVSPTRGTYSPKRVPRLIHANRNRQIDAGNSPRASTSTAAESVNHNLFEDTSDSASDNSELMTSGPEQFQNVDSQGDNANTDTSAANNSETEGQQHQSLQQHLMEVAGPAMEFAIDITQFYHRNEVELADVVPIFLSLLNRPMIMRQCYAEEYKTRLAELNSLCPPVPAKMEDFTDQCVICQSEFEPDQHIRLLLCDHKFHVACIDKWCKCAASCPVCRRGFNGNIIEEQAPPRSPPTTYLMRIQSESTEESDTNSVSSSNDASTT